MELRRRSARNLRRGGFMRRRTVSQLLPLSPLSTMPIPPPSNGNHVDISAKDTAHNNFHASSEVPVTSDLRIRLTAGNLTTGAIRGRKDIENKAGNVEITVGDPNDYFKADGSVSVGNLEADPFDTSKGGFFRSFKWSGHGKYQFHAHVGAGNLSLRR